ncbi:MAG: glutamine amidotransferase [Gammaproteobacteria bacterium]|nr:glutamine amidotransferase [Gammaproteobacteria bacterium]MCZ6498677.1 glutamine amidotransferase [Gammaproteobacteria bacterium]
MFELLFKYSRTTFEQGDFLFASGWPLWLLVVVSLAATIGIGYSLLQRRDSLSLVRLIALAGLQTAMVTLVLVLLWQPALSSDTLRAEDNTVALLLDTSASMSYGEAEESRLQQAVAALNDGVLEDLSATLETRLYAFSKDSITIDSLEQVPPPGAATHLGDAVLGVLREARTSALGAVVLISDGADNSNELDTARLAEIAGFGVPVYTVGVGRETIPEDVELESVIMTTQVTAGSRVSAQVSIRHARPGTVRLKVYDGDAILSSEELTLPDRDGVTTHWVDFDVGDVGVKDLRFVLDAIPGERNTVNNVQSRVIEVPAERRRILYIEGEPRWEYKFIRRAVEENSPIRLASLLRTTPNKFYRQGIDDPTELENGFPEDRETLFNYDALIIGSFEAAALTPEQLDNISAFVSERGGSLLMLAGLRGLADGGWGNSVVADVLPAHLPDIDATTFLRLPAKVSLTPAGEDSLLTRLDSDRDANIALWEEMPDIADYQYLDGLKPGAETLLEVDIQGTNHPLLVHQRYGRGHAFILATGGTWRWQMQLPSEDQRHETFWRQMLRALVSSSPRPVVLSAERLFYADDTEVTLRAEVKNKEYLPVANAAVSVSVTTDVGGPAQVIEMQAIPGEFGMYAATIQADRTGMYRFEVEARLGEESLGEARLAVRRADGIVEHFQIQQNRSLLENLANMTGGRYFSLDDLDALPETIQFSDAGILETKVLDLWNMPIVFLLLLLLKTGEWLLRLFWGRL